MSERRKFKMTLRIKPEFNPPKIGKTEEPGLIATQVLSVPADTKTDNMFLVGIMEVEEEFMKKYIEVVTEEIKG